MRKENSLHKWLRKFPGTPVLVIGDVMVDHYVRGQVDRLNPEAPVPVVSVEKETFVPGGAANVAANLAALKSQTILVGLIGPDTHGAQLTNDLKLMGMPTQGLIQDPSRPTTVKTRVIADHQQVVRFDREDRTLPGIESLKALETRLEEFIPQVRVVIVSDYGKGVINQLILRRLLTLARKHRVIVSVDPKVEHFFRYRGVDCITPNQNEAAEGMRVLPPVGDKDLESLGFRILKKLKCRSVLITRGEHGMTLFQKSRPMTHISTVVKEVFDVTGAGDTVIASLSLALAVGAPIEKAAHLANAAASIVVGKLGTATVSLSELRSAIR